MRASSTAEGLAAAAMPSERSAAIVTSMRIGALARPGDVEHGLCHEAGR